MPCDECEEMRRKLREWWAWLAKTEQSDETEPVNGDDPS